MLFVYLLVNEDVSSGFDFQKWQSYYNIYIYKVTRYNLQKYNVTVHLFLTGFKKGGFQLDFSVVLDMPPHRQSTAYKNHYWAYELLLFANN